MTEARVQSIAQFRPRRTELRALWNLALPIVTVQVGIMLMGVVDTIMVGHLSREALAAVAVGNMYFWAAGTFSQGVLFSVDPLISQAVGARDELAIARAVQRGFVIALMLTLLISGIALIAEPVLTALRQPPEIVPTAALFARVMIPGALPLLLFMVLRQCLQSMTILRPVLVSIIVANLVNLGLNVILIYGRFGFPAMGVAGSAWATSISRFAMFGIVMIAGWKHVKPYVRHLRRDAFELGPILNMLGLGAPIGVHHILEYGAFAAVMIFMGMLGTVQTASHQVAINLAALTFMVPLGVSQAGSVLVGHAVGRGDDQGARRAAGAAAIIGCSFMAITMLIFLGLSRPLAIVYTSDATVIPVAATLIRIAGVFQVFDGIQVVCSGVLRGVGDTRVPMLVGLVSFWLFGMPISIWLGMIAGRGASGLWWGLVVGLAVVAVFLLIRVFYRFGRHLVRIDVEH